MRSKFSRKRVKYNAGGVMQGLQLLQGLQGAQGISGLQGVSGVGGGMPNLSQLSSISNNMPTLGNIIANNTKDEKAKNIFRLIGASNPVSFLSTLADMTRPKENADLLADIEALEKQNQGVIAQEGQKVEYRIPDDYALARLKARKQFRKTPMYSEPYEDMYYKAKDIDPAKIDFSKPIDFGDYKFVFENNPVAMSYARAFKRSFPDAPNEVVEAAVVGLLPEQERMIALAKKGGGDVKAGYDWYNKNINENKDKYEFVDMGTRFTISKDGELTAKSEEDRIQRFQRYSSPVKEEPVKEEPAKDVPVKDISVKEEPISPEPQTPKQEPPRQETPKQEPVKEEKPANPQKLPYTPYQLQRQGYWLEGLTQLGTGLPALIKGLQAYRKLQKLERPLLQLQDLIRPAEKDTLEDEREKLKQQLYAYQKNLTGNTGNLQALMAGLQNLQKQEADAFGNMQTAENNRFAQDFLREVNQAREQHLKNQELLHQWKEKNYETAARNLMNAAERGRATFENSLQQTLNLLRDARMNKMQHHKQIYDAMRVYRGAKKDYIERMKQATPSFFYKTDAQGNPLRDANGNLIPTSQEEKNAMLARWGKEFDEGEGKEYADLVRQVMDYGGKYGKFLGEFQYNTADLPYDLYPQDRKKFRQKRTLYSTQQGQEGQVEQTTQPLTQPNGQTENITGIFERRNNPYPVFGNSQWQQLEQQTDNRLQQLYPHLYGKEKFSNKGASGKLPFRTSLSQEQNNQGQVEQGTQLFENSQWQQLEQQTNNRLQQLYPYLYRKEKLLNKKGISGKFPFGTNFPSQGQNNQGQNNNVLSEDITQYISPEELLPYQFRQPGIYKKGGKTLYQDSGVLDTHLENVTDNPNMQMLLTLMQMQQSKQGDKKKSKDDSESTMGDSYLTRLQKNIQKETMRNIQLANLYKQKLHDSSRRSVERARQIVAQLRLV